MQLHCSSCELTVTDDCTCSCTCTILSAFTTSILSIVVNGKCMDLEDQPSVQI